MRVAVLSCPFQQAAVFLWRSTPAPIPAFRPPGRPLRPTTAAVLMRTSPRSTTLLFVARAIALWKVIPRCPAIYSLRVCVDLRTCFCAHACVCATEIFHVFHFPGPVPMLLQSHSTACIRRDTRSAAFLHRFFCLFDKPSPPPPPEPLTPPRLYRRWILAGSAQGPRRQALLP